MHESSLAKRCVAEAAETCLLVAAVVGSGIMGEQLAGGNIAIALLANTIATGAALVALILCFGSISGAHFNPAVTLADCMEGGLPWRECSVYMTAQIVGGCAGAVLANAMFTKPLVSWSQHARSGVAQLLSEFVATFGLIVVIWVPRATTVVFAVAAYIMAAYWFTASTSFANPAVTIARCLSDTFAGIRPRDVLPFVAVQLAAAGASTMFFRWLSPRATAHAAEVVVPRN